MTGFDINFELIYLAIPLSCLAGAMLAGLLGVAWVARRRRLPPPRARLAFARFLKAAARAFADIRRFFRATPVAR